MEKNRFILLSEIIERLETNMAFKLRSCQRTLARKKKTANTLNIKHNPIIFFGKKEMLYEIQNELA